MEEENHKAIEARIKKIGVERYTETPYQLDFLYKGVKYAVKHNNLLEEERDQLIQDIKNSHESLIDKYNELSGVPPITNGIVIISVAENREIEKISFPRAGKVTLLDASLINLHLKV